MPPAPNRKSNPLETLIHFPGPYIPVADFALRREICVDKVKGAVKSGGKMSRLQQLPNIVTAIGGLGTAAFGLVDSTFFR